MRKVVQLDTNASVARRKKHDKLTMIGEIGDYFHISVFRCGYVSTAPNVRQRMLNTLGVIGLSMMNV